MTYFFLVLAKTVVVFTDLQAACEAQAKQGGRLDKFVVSCAMSYPSQNGIILNNGGFGVPNKHYWSQAESASCSFAEPVLTPDIKCEEIQPPKVWREKP